MTNLCPPQTLNKSFMLANQRASSKLYCTEKQFSSQEESPDLNISESCRQKLRELNAGSDSTKMLRLVVEGGGCSGFQYKFDLDDSTNSDDRIFGCEPNCQVVVDEVSLSLVRGAHVEFHTELIRSSFRIANNPQSAEGCSCGASFSVKI